MNLNKRMKRYEKSYNFLVPPRTYVVIRCDGKNFSKFTKNMVKPFDESFSMAMHHATIMLCEYFNPDFAYTQSDEISLVITDFGIDAQQAFDGKVQKLCSLSASVAAVNFNNMLTIMNSDLYSDARDFMRDVNEGTGITTANFDSRVFIIPDYREVLNYFIWRQQDATRNSVSMAAQALYSHKELQGKSGSDKQDMMMEKDVNWNDYPVRFKRGVVAYKKTFFKEVEGQGPVERRKWTIDHETPIFTQNREYLMNLLPSTLLSDDNK